MPTSPPPLQQRLLRSSVASCTRSKPWSDFGWRSQSRKRADLAGLKCAAICKVDFEMNSSLTTTTATSELSPGTRRRALGCASLIRLKSYPETWTLPPNPPWCAQTNVNSPGTRCCSQRPSPRPAARPPAAALRLLRRSTWQSSLSLFQPFLSTDVSSTFDSPTKATVPGY